MRFVLPLQLFEPLLFARLCRIQLLDHIAGLVALRAQRFELAAHLIATGTQPPDSLCQFRFR